MKALTIYQPWASLIMAGAKTVEWRGWALHRSLIGQRIAIHASARPVRHAEVVDILQRIEEGETSLDGPLAKELLLSKINAPRVWPRSSVLGTAIIGAPVPALDWVREHTTGHFDSDRIDHHNGPPGG